MDFSAGQNSTAEEIKKIVSVLIQYIEGALLTTPVIQCTEAADFVWPEENDTISTHYSLV